MIIVLKKYNQYFTEKKEKKNEIHLSFSLKKLNFVIL